MLTTEYSKHVFVNMSGQAHHLPCHLSSSSVSPASTSELWISMTWTEVCLLEPLEKTWGTGRRVRGGAVKAEGKEEV